jgi:hypothetical protein
MPKTVVETNIQPVQIVETQPTQSGVISIPNQKAPEQTRIPYNRYIEVPNNGLVLTQYISISKTAWITNIKIQSAANAAPASFEYIAVFDGNTGTAADKLLVWGYIPLTGGVLWNWNYETRPIKIDSGFILLLNTSTSGNGSTFCWIDGFSVD